MGRVKDKRGQCFDRLIVIARVGSDKSNRTRWLCLCDCDNYIVVSGDSLGRRKVMSCGCHKGNNESKYSHTKLYGIWDSITDLPQQIDLYGITPACLKQLCICLSSLMRSAAAITSFRNCSSEVGTKLAK